MSVMKPEATRRIQVEDLFYNPFIGFANSKLPTSTQQAYPRYNLISRESGYLLEVSALGLTKDSIEIKLKSGVLSIKAEKQEPAVGEYIERGISGKGFELSFNVNSSISVTDIFLENGILSIELTKDNEEAYLLEIR
ncbi:MAG: hypothetical protein DRJ64_09420 [Thermoprotei archaeon]|nr:MAG: hypothetical protein DRJ64_09420 [Thermoprotei archaeon]